MMIFDGGDIDVNEEEVEEEDEEDDVDEVFVRKFFFYQVQSGHCLLGIDGLNIVSCIDLFCRQIQLPFSVPCRVLLWRAPRPFEIDLDL